MTIRRQGRAPVHNFQRLYYVLRLAMVRAELGPLVIGQGLRGHEVKGQVGAPLCLVISPRAVANQTLAPPPQQEYLALQNLHPVQKVGVQLHLLLQFLERLEAGSHAQFLALNYLSQLLRLSVLDRPDQVLVPLPNGEFSLEGVIVIGAQPRVGFKVVGESLRGALRMFDDSLTLTHQVVGSDGAGERVELEIY